MTAIITQKFRQHNATQFIESFSETAGNTYYVMYGKSMPFTAATSGGDDVDVPSPLDDVTLRFILKLLIIGCIKCLTTTAELHIVVLSQHLNPLRHLVSAGMFLNICIRLVPLNSQNL